MPSNSTARRRRRHGSSLPASILLDVKAYVETRRDATTAVAETSNKLAIEASFCPARPPLPSKLFVFVHGADVPDPPEILGAAQDLFLIRVAFAVGDGPTTSATSEFCDYFIYRARRPSLERIPNPEPIFRGRNLRACLVYGHRLPQLTLGLTRCGMTNLWRGKLWPPTKHALSFFGLLPRAGDLYTVAELSFTSRDLFELCRFDSEAGSWTSKAVSLEAPITFPVEIPTKASRLRYHITTTVITLGGEAGTMGWVDLWNGVLLHDMLREDHQDRLRRVPLPLPMDAITCNHGKGAEVGSPVLCRGIAVFTKSGKVCLKLAELQNTGERLPYTDAETGWPAFRVDDWSITTWSNTKMAGAYDDWREDFTVLASGIKIGDAVRSRLRESGLLQCKRPAPDGEGGEEEVVELALQNLAVSEPRPSLNAEDDVVYVMAKTKFMQKKAWVLAVDMRSSSLLGVAEFSSGRWPDADFTYHLGTTRLLPPSI
ncbi:hypothetical protein ACP70R_004728 [Stipagrostis hirtigluma subsp. patula]